MNLNWSHHYQHILKIVRDTTTHLSNSYATTAQKMRTLQACIKTKIRYAFCVAPFTNSQIKTMDGLLTKAAKRAYRLPTNISTAAAHEDVALGGLGCPSILVEYHTVQVQRLAGPAGPACACARWLARRVTARSTAARGTADVCSST
jgi:hypothetical protein